MIKYLVLLLCLMTPGYAMQPLSLPEYQQFQNTLKKMDGCFDVIINQDGTPSIWLRTRYQIGPIIYHEKISGYDYTALIGKVFPLSALLQNTQMVDAYDKGCW